MQIPDEGQAQGDFLRDRGLAEEEGKRLLVALLRCQLIVRSRRDDGAWLSLTERGRAARDLLGGGEQTPAGFVGGTGDGWIASRPDEILNRLLQLRRGLVNWFSLPGHVPDRPDDLTAHQREALLRMPAEGVTMREFADILGIPPASAPALADRLVARALVDREADAADRRVVRLVPTALGQHMAEHFRRAQRRAINGLLHEMDEHQLEALARMTELLTRQGSATAAATGPGDHA